MVYRIYYESIKGWAKENKIKLYSSIGIIFSFLIAFNMIEVINYSDSMACKGDTWDNACEFSITFRANDDIFLYPIGYDPYGRDTFIQFEPGVIDWRLYRTWGDGLREINLNEGCTGTWCGKSKNDKRDVATFSYAFRKGKIYTLIVKALKDNPEDIIKWAALDGKIDPYFWGVDKYGNELKEIPSNDFMRVNSEWKVKGNVSNYDISFSDKKNIKSDITIKSQDDKIKQIELLDKKDKNIFTKEKSLSFDSKTKEVITKCESGYCKFNPDMVFIKEFIIEKHGIVINSSYYIENDGEFIPVIDDYWYKGDGKHGVNTTNFESEFQKGKVEYYFSEPMTYDGEASFIKKIASGSMTDSYFKIDNSDLYNYSVNVTSPTSAEVYFLWVNGTADPLVQDYNLSKGYFNVTKGAGLIFVQGNESSNVELLLEFENSIKDISYNEVRLTNTDYTQLYTDSDDNTKAIQFNDDSDTLYFPSTDIPENTSNLTILVYLKKVDSNDGSSQPIIDNRQDGGSDVGGFELRINEGDPFSISLDFGNGSVQSNENSNAIYKENEWICLGFTASLESGNFRYFNGSETSPEQDTNELSNHFDMWSENVNNYYIGSRDNGEGELEANVSKILIAYRWFTDKEAYDWCNNAYGGLFENKGTYSSEVKYLNQTGYNKINVTSNVSCNGLSCPGIGVRSFFSDEDILALWMGHDFEDHGNKVDYLGTTIGTTNILWEKDVSYDHTQVQGSYLFSSPNPAITLPNEPDDSILDLKENFTICSWHNLTSGSDIITGYSASPPLGYRVECNTNYYFNFYGTSDFNWVTQLGGGNCMNGQWNFVCVGYNSTHFFGFRNGVFAGGDATTGFVGDFNNTRTLGIYADGHIPMIFILNRSATFEWMDEVYNKTKIYFNNFTYKTTTEGNNIYNFSIDNTSTHSQISFSLNANSTVTNTINDFSSIVYTQTESSVTTTTTTTTTLLCDGTEDCLIDCSSTGNIFYDIIGSAYDILFYNTGVVDINSTILFNNFYIGKDCILNIDQSTGELKEI